MTSHDIPCCPLVAFKVLNESKSCGEDILELKDARFQLKSYFCHQVPQSFKSACSYDRYYKIERLKGL